MPGRAIGDQRIPTPGAPGFGNAVALENQVGHAELAQVLTHGHACLAGTDAAYDEWGTTLATALRDAGAKRVVIAGRPIDGIDDSAALGVDALAFLTRTREALG